MLSAEQAAEGLGVDVFDLAVALRSFAVVELERQTAVVRRGDERPNLGRFRRLLAAAEACEAAWDELTSVTSEDAHSHARADQ